jgi:hypothetical protein
MPSPSIRLDSNSRNRGGYGDLVKRAERYARERLAGLTVINHATQLAITLTPNALKAATAPGAPAELLRLLPHLPQILSHALYIRTTADPLGRPGVRQVHVLGTSPAAAGRPPEVLFRVRENFQSQCFLDRIALRRIPKRRLAGGGDVPDSPDPGAQGKAAASPVNIFLGGALDRDSSHIVRDYADRFQQAHPETNVHYFPNDDCEGPLNTIRNAPAGAPVNLVGHSWGAQSAALCIAGMARTGIHVNNLITVDPVGRLPIPDGFRDAAGNWINITATPSAPDRSDTVAKVGGKGSNLPVDQADTHYSIDANHREFGRMMTSPGPSGLSPEQILLGNGDAPRLSPPTSAPSDGN